MVTIASQLKKGQTFKIKGKRKMYTIEDIFFNYNYFSVLIYFRISALNFGKIKLSKNEIVIVY